VIIYDLLFLSAFHFLSQFESFAVVYRTDAETINGSTYERKMFRTYCLRRIYFHSALKRRRVCRAIDRSFTRQKMELIRVVILYNISYEIRLK